MESAVDQEWQRKNGSVRVKVKDRMFHQDRWWVLVAWSATSYRRRSWWMREVSFVDRYVLLDNADGSLGD